MAELIEKTPEGGRVYVLRGGPEVDVERRRRREDEENSFQLSRGQLRMLARLRALRAMGERDLQEL